MAIPYEETFAKKITGIAEESIDDMFSRRRFEASLIGIRAEGDSNWIPAVRSHPEQTPYWSGQKLDSLLTSINYYELIKPRSNIQDKYAIQTKEIGLFLLNGTAFYGQNVEIPPEFSQVNANLWSDGLKKALDMAILGKIPSYHPDSLKLFQKNDTYFRAREYLGYLEDGQPPPKAIVQSDSINSIFLQNCSITGNIVKKKNKVSFDPEYLTLKWVDPNKNMPSRSLCTIKFEDLERFGIRLNGKKPEKFMRSFQYFFVLRMLNQYYFPNLEETFLVKGILLNGNWQDLPNLY